MRLRRSRAGLVLIFAALLVKLKAGMLLGALVLLVVAVALVGLFTIASAAKRIKPRTLPPEETNSFYLYFRPDIVYASSPQQPDPNPPSLAAQAKESGVRSQEAEQSSSLPVYFWHTNELTFLDCECLEDSWIVIERTQDYVNWTVLRWVMFDEPTYTNGNGYQKFVDLYAPVSGMSFYRGLIITNAP